MQKQFNRLFGAALGTMISVIVNATANASDYVDPNLIGGEGGAYALLECPAGMRIAGVSGRRGEWIDGISIICAELIPNPLKKNRWDQEFVYGAKWESPYFGGPGGEPHRMECRDGVTITDLLVRPSWETTPRYVTAIALDCPAAVQDLSESNAAPSGYFGKKGHAGQMHSELSRRLVGYRKCPDGKVMTGLAIRAGDYLDAISISCSWPIAVNARVLGGVISQQRKPADITGVGGASPDRRTPSGGVAEAKPIEVPPAPIAPRRHDAPVIVSDDGVPERLDYCLNFAERCGDDAAAAFCAANDPQRPVVLEAPLEFGVGRTFTIGDRRLCEQDNCSSFSYVICGSQ